MNAPDTTSPQAGPENVDEFLGEKPRPRWRRWMKFWLPAVIVLALVAAFALLAWAVLVLVYYSLRDRQ